LSQFPVNEMLPDISNSMINWSKAHPRATGDIQPMKTPVADNQTALIALGAVCFVLFIGITGLWGGMSPSADVTARAKGIPVNLSAIPEGEQIMITYAGKPVMIRRDRRSRGD
jgi:hypothetical protein